MFVFPAAGGDDTLWQNAQCPCSSRQFVPFPPPQIHVKDCVREEAALLRGVPTSNNGAMLNF